MTFRQANTEALRRLGATDQFIEGVNQAADAELAGALDTELPERHAEAMICHMMAGHAQILAMTDKERAEWDRQWEAEVREFVRGELKMDAEEPKPLTRMAILVCRLFHRFWHRQYWTEFSKTFHRCKRCGRHWSKPRLNAPQGERPVRGPLRDETLGPWSS